MIHIHGNLKCLVSQLYREFVGSVLSYHLYKMRQPLRGGIIRETDLMFGPLVIPHFFGFDTLGQEDFERSSVVVHHQIVALGTGRYRLVNASGVLVIVDL